MSVFDFEGKPCKVRCPKCKGDHVWLTEWWNDNVIYFHVRDGKMPGEAEDHDGGHPVAVSAGCMDQSCAHKWTIRGARSIRDVIKD